MKKLIMTAAVVACAAVVTAQTVTSANIVGYSKNSAVGSGAIDIVSPQFLAGDVGMTIADAFSGVTEGAVVYKWNGAGYDVATFYEGFGWFDAGFNPKDDVLIAQGEAVWLQGGASTVDVITSGEVPMADSITNSLAVASISMVANPYPVAMTIDDIPLTNISEGDIIYLWNGSGYVVATYYAGFGWFDAGFNPLGTTPIAVGQGFWLQCATGGDLIFNKNF